jgi:ABC-type multidrug transport system ATPase subunit
MHTAAHLLKHALTGPLASNRCIILVTHHVRLCLPSAAYVVELENGQIIRAGTPTELDHLGILEAVIEEEDHVPLDDPEPVAHDVHTRDTTMQVFQRQHTDGKLVEDEARAEGRGTYHLRTIRIVLIVLAQCHCGHTSHMSKLRALRRGSAHLY